MDRSAIDAREGGSIFSLEKRADGIAIVRFATPGRSQNVVDDVFIEQWAALMTSIVRDAEILGLVLASARPDGFIAGADIDAFDRFPTAIATEQFVRRVQAGFSMLAGAAFPVVAAIDGDCLGVGLELAMACDARIVADNENTRLGLPDIRLGLPPAAGGTQRLPRLVGIDSALDLMLTGRTLAPRQAEQQGLVDAVVSSSDLVDAAIDRAARQARRNVLRAPGLVATARRRIGNGLDGLSQAAVEDNPLGRRLLFDRARERARERTQGHYPAIEKIIDAVECGYTRGVQPGLVAEAKAFGELALGPVSRALRHLARESDALAQRAFGTGNARARPPDRIGVLGAGLMGAGIAAVSLAATDARVILKDVEEENLGKARAHIARAMDRRVRQHRIARDGATARLTALTTTLDYAALADADIVIEAVFEDLTLKRLMLSDVESAAEARGKTDQIFASNTSALPIGEIAAHAARPENVVGMHYFSPVEKMALLEIVATPKTSRKTIATALALGRAQGKTAIVVGDAPGFYTTRVLSPYLNEAARLLDEGATITEIDRALTRAGFPVGPLTLLDEVGVDVGAKIGPVLARAFGDRFAVPAASAWMVEAGFLGRKTGNGFYDYQAARRRGQRPVNAELAQMLAARERDWGATPGPQDIVDRCVFAFVNEAAHCLSEGIIKDPAIGDVGAVLGLGFLPFTGGPFRYMDTCGIEEVIEQLETLSALHGPRFEPAPVLRSMAAASRASQRRFYS